MVLVFKFVLSYYTATKTVFWGNVHCDALSDTIMSSRNSTVLIMYPYRRVISSVLVFLA